MWKCVVVFLLWMGSGGCAEKAGTSDLIEYTAADFYEKLHSGKTMFVYFQRQVSPTISLFLAELEKSADALKDYGVLVGKVNCNKEKVSEYCSEEKVVHTAFLFRGGKEFLGFGLDTVFDDNSIVSEVLFAILRDEVKYVHTEADLLAMEKAAKGKKDIVLGYVRSLGTQEHRSMMETAFVYGSKYQFILITGGPVLKHLGVDESRSSQVWFLHCRLRSGLKTAKTSEHCPLTRMRKNLSTLTLHAFLQLMEAPLVSEVYDDPSSVQRPQFPYQLTPQIFLFSRPKTKHADMDTATTLAWKLRGLALVLLVHRQSPSVKTPNQYNAAFRLPERSSQVKYMTYQHIDEVYELFANKEKEQEEQGGLLEDEEADPHSTKLDDEIAAAVHEKRADPLDMDLIVELTSDNFLAEVAESSLTVVLFYYKWEAVSKVFLSYFIEVAERLGDSEVQMAAVDCGEWSDLCAADIGNDLQVPFQPITVFPTVLLIRPKEPAQRYEGMLGAEALHRFIVMSQPASPALLSTEDEVMSFLQKVPHPDLAAHKPVDRVLGLFKTLANTVVAPFIEAAKSLRGEVLTAMLTENLAKTWAAKHNLALPALLVFPSWGTPARPSTLPVSSCPLELRSHIDAALLHPLPELTVENLPSYLSQGKALLLLFVGEEEDEIGRKQNQALVEEMRAVVETGGEKMAPYQACWIHLGRTPAGMSVLGSYLGSMPPLPALVLTHLPSGNEIYQFAPNTPIAASSVLQWLNRIEQGEETAAGMIGEGNWPASPDFLDFLKIIDMDDPEAAKQQTPTKKVEEEEEVIVEEDEEEEEASSSSPEINLHTEL